MAILLNDNLDVAAIKPVDSRYGTYTSISEANAAIPAIKRYRGLTVGIISNEILIEYWYETGIANTDLVIKQYSLSFIDGTNIDQLKTITKLLTLTTDWQDTGINGVDLSSGTYIIQLFANDSVNINEYYSGVLSWYAGSTQTISEMPSDEINLHRAGGSNEGIEIYLRTLRTDVPGILKLQIYSNYEFASANNYVFKFRRMI